MPRLTNAADDVDELLPAAIDVVMETGQASVSMLQRRLKLGYSRAARIVDEMETRGIVGPFEGSKPRQLLITNEQWQELQDEGRLRRNAAGSGRASAAGRGKLNKAKAPKAKRLSVLFLRVSVSMRTGVA